MTYMLLLNCALKLVEEIILCLKITLQTLSIRSQKRHTYRTRPLKLEVCELGKTEGSE